ncbi:MAG: hypothetical protein BECKG1743D_GA0114223_111671 [Candidatus Kentron sp. G]|nr:MAG: hypothetical protein BECKG1743D_GA0114223_111671 [Candidatus Kentron sp. G]
MKSGSEKAELMEVNEQANFTLGLGTQNNFYMQRLRQAFQVIAGKEYTGLRDKFI